MTSVKDAVAVVTGGSRGIGKALVAALYERGAAKVYATARDPRAITHPDAVPLALELTDPVHTTRAFVPALERNGGGHILTIHSVLSWLALPGVEAYSASKAALWSQTNALRLALRPRGIAVTGLHVGYVDTDMAAGIDAPKTSPHHVAELALDGIEAGTPEVLADDLTRQVKAALSADPTVLYPQLAVSA